MHQALGFRSKTAALAFLYARGFVASLERDKRERVTFRLRLELVGTWNGAGARAFLNPTRRGTWSLTFGA